MSWISQRSAQSANLYRYIAFQGARILEDFELNSLQDILTSKADNSFSGVFSEGGLVNAAFTISGLTISLAAADGTRPILAFFHGALEPVAPFSYTFGSGLSSGTSTLYLHWVLWRVTADGTHASVSGCLVDPTLSDSISSEPTAERGQLQIVLSVTTDLSTESINTTTMIAKSTTAVPVYTMNWAAGVMTGSQPTTVNPDLLATQQNSGFVKLTTNTSAGVAAASDDPRMSDSRQPLFNSVADGSVTSPAPAFGAQIAQISAAEYIVGSLGIGSAKIVYETLGARLKDYLDWANTQILALLSTLAGLASRLSILENKVPPVLDLSWHVGKPLGIPGDHGTHLPVYTSSTDGFQQNGAGAVDVPAYAVNNNGTREAYISQAGDYLINNPALLTPGVPSSLSGLMNFVSGLAPKGSIAPSGPTPGATGAAGADGAQVTNVGSQTSGGVNWIFFQLGAYLIGAGSGVLASGDVLTFPSGWNAVETIVTGSLAVTQPTDHEVQIFPPDVSNGWAAQVYLNGSDGHNLATGGWYMNVLAFSIAVA